MTGIEIAYIVTIAIAGILTIAQFLFQHRADIRATMKELLSVFGA